MVAPSTSQLKVGTTLPQETSLPRRAENSSREDTKTPNKEGSKCRLRAAEIEEAVSKAHCDRFGVSSDTFVGNIRG